MRNRRFIGGVFADFIVKKRNENLYHVTADSVKAQTLTRQVQKKDIRFGVILMNIQMDKEILESFKEAIKAESPDWIASWIVKENK